MIVFTKSQLDLLIAHALRESPREACGVIVGTLERDAKKAMDIYKCTNIDTAPESSYEINPSELLRVMEDAERRRLDILGFYHSHPMALTRPSAADEFKATWPGHSYVIVSPRGTPAVTSWIWTEETGFVREEVVIE